MIRAALLIVLLTLLLPATVFADAPRDERILSFHSDITVNEDGWLDVTETITVHAAGQQIKRGIYRDFPTLYHGRFLSRHAVPFEVVEVTLPAVISVVREVNEPRIPSLMNIMKAKRKPTEEWDSAALGLSVEEVRAGSSVEVVRVEAPLVERKRVVIEADTVEEAAMKLAEAIVAERVLER